MDPRILLSFVVAIAAGLANNPALSGTASFPQVITKDDIATPVLKLDQNVTYDNFIPLINHSTEGFKVKGLQYTPVSAALKCLSYFSYLRNETASFYGVYVADWLAARGNETADYIVFAHDFPWPLYNLTAGWKSALAQAHVAECFMEAYERTQDDKYLTLAKKSLMFLSVPVSEGGVLIDEAKNRWWYEEYPSKGGSYVLNGHQFVLIALSKYLQIQDDPAIRELLDNGLNALKDTALQYDDGFNNSFYDRLGHPASTYHKTHIINFQKLFDITGDHKWLEIKKAFEE